MSLLGIIAILLVLLFVGLIVLKIVASLALALFWPLVLITLGAALGVWIVGRRTAR